MQNDIPILIVIAMIKCWTSSLRCLPVCWHLDMLLAMSGSWLVEIGVNHEFGWEAPRVKAAWCPGVFLIAWTFYAVGLCASMVDIQEGHFSDHTYAEKCEAFICAEIKYITRVRRARESGSFVFAELLHLYTMIIKAPHLAHVGPYFTFWIAVIQLLWQTSNCIQLLMGIFYKNFASVL